MTKWSMLMPLRLLFTRGTMGGKNSRLVIAWLANPTYAEASFLHYPFITRLAIASRAVLFDNSQRYLDIWI